MAAGARASSRVGTYNRVGCLVSVVILRSRDQRDGELTADVLAGLASGSSERADAQEDGGEVELHDDG